ncbi:DNA topoisomerase I [Steroidobacter denitrificans]|uniref:DNA topoisomerase 1 n=1 Tax=Steroidobacter denitrificans TaxID=465721 RepID=A0A127F598_STEDE|nr:DNA topoisomerase I [Steroidobacter denitrificans]AMN45612.1 DNA topoisomerase I [Steroidobacter denitrificans]
MDQKNLVIVESPAKAKTIKKYLGSNFEVLASYGHVRDLVPKEGAVDPQRDFAMRYQILDKNEKHVQAITRALKKSDALYLATDPDREGEAISWHLAELLKERGALDGKDVHRVVFYEITRNAIREAIQHPRGISQDLVDAQQARRALDYLVGFNLSPLLWKKAGLSGASAGRVQSPALRMICEREEEIARFQSREYWTIDAHARKVETGSGQTSMPQPNRDLPGFFARLIEYQGRKVEQFTITTEAEAGKVRGEIEQAAGILGSGEVAGSAAAPGTLTVAAIDRKQRRRNPAPPFTTSTLQQEAARKLGFGAQRTMRLAQQLYEGVDFGEGAVGLITYMRTDSVNLANEALQEIRQVIGQLYGTESLPDAPRHYKTKSKNAQEAHEAVRPTSAALTPERLEGKIDADQFKLYSLIWKRAVASQMEPAVYDTVAVDLLPGTSGRREDAAAVLRANGSTLVKPGYIAVYKEGLDDVSDDDDDRILPPMAVGDTLSLLQVRPEQHFTEPPPRYSEASLVKALEEHGIGRPSTYASIIQTLIGKKYAELLNRRFVPTDLGKIVNRFLTRNFHHYVEYGFTAKMEDNLDEIAGGKEAWIPVLERFWKEFKQRVDHVDETVTREDVSEARELGSDPRTGKPISVRYGKYGPFVQLGTKDDEEKPRFASLRPTQRMDSITLEEALELFTLPRTVGETPEGHPIKIAIGRFGPYVQYGQKKFVSIKDDDPYTIGLSRALELIRAKEELDANRTLLDFPEAGIQVLNGRFGPYITDRVKNAKIPKDRDPKTLTLEECRELLAAAPERGKGRFGRFAKKTAATAGATAAPAVAAVKKDTTRKGAAKQDASGAGTNQRGATHSARTRSAAATPKAARKPARKAAVKNTTAAPTSTGKGRKPAAKRASTTK